MRNKARVQLAVPHSWDHSPSGALKDCAGVVSAEEEAVEMMKPWLLIQPGLMFGMGGKSNSQPLNCSIRSVAFPRHYRVGEQSSFAQSQPLSVSVPVLQIPVAIRRPQSSGL